MAVKDLETWQTLNRIEEGERALIICAEFYDASFTSALWQSVAGFMERGEEVPPNAQRFLEILHGKAEEAVNGAPVPPTIQILNRALFADLDDEAEELEEVLQAFHKTTGKTPPSVYCADYHPDHDLTLKPYPFPH